VRTRVLTSVAALLLLCASAAAAADISGKWHAQIPWPGRNLTDFYFALNVDGAKLTGTVTYAVGDGLSRMEIIEGKAGGDDVSFAVVVTQRNTQAKWIFKGKLTGEVMPFTVEMPAAAPPAAPGGPAPAGGAPAAPAGSAPAAPAGSAPAVPAGGAPVAPAAGAPGAPGAPAGGAPVVLAFTAKRGTF
jgi:hypothetical protein